jgi:rhodanese-related sulfurtransferase
MISPVVTPAQARSLVGAVFADVRWYLDGRSGRSAWLSGHLPGAVFVDLNTALAGPPSTEAGRHPLPEPEAFAAAMAELGIGETDVVIAYDDAGGSSAGRLVWLLRNIGVEAALLDGGIAGWDGVVETGETLRPAATFNARPWDAATLATIDDAATAYRVVDARAGARYRGETEPVDVRGRSTARTRAGAGAPQSAMAVDLGSRFSSIQVSMRSGVNTSLPASRYSWSASRASSTRRASRAPGRSRRARPGAARRGPCRSGPAARSCSGCRPGRPAASRRTPGTGWPTGRGSGTPCAWPSGRGPVSGMRMQAERLRWL